MTTIIHIPDFHKSLARLTNFGGQPKKHGDKVHALLSRLTMAESADRSIQEILAEGDPPLTHNGETRIKSCRKYNLGNGYRLVTVHDKGAVCFCFVGSHDDTDEWLNRNAGFVLTRNRRGELVRARKTSLVGEGAILPRGGYASPDPVLELLSLEEQDTVLEEVSGRVSRDLYKVYSSTAPNIVENLCANINDQGARSFVLDVLKLLQQGDIESARTRIHLQGDELQELSQADSRSMLRVQQGDEFLCFEVGSPEYVRWYDRFAKMADYVAWLLFMHPDQKALADKDFAGTALLTGVSGSGKTCIAVDRALRLAEADESAQILIVTLNKSLAGLIQHLVQQAAPDTNTTQRVKVKSLFELCQELLFTFDPTNRRLYTDISIKLGEHVDEIFREFYRCWNNNEDAEVLLPLHHHLVARGLNAEKYVREEFDYIRTAFFFEAREEYLKVQRSGRKYPIQAKYRRLLLDGLARWEEKMRAVGVIDYVGLASALGAFRDQLVPLYDHVIIDEAQDFGTTELALVRALVPSGPNDLLLCGDIAQHVLPKHRVLKQAGIRVSETSEIRKNYRNTREILEAAYDVLEANLTDEMLDSEDLKVLDPEYAQRHGTTPLALRAEDLEEELAYALAHVRDTIESASVEDVRCCIAFAGFSLREVQLFANRICLPVLDGDFDPKAAEDVVLSDLEQTKGYEFHHMVILNCSHSVLPRKDMPEDEVFRDACRLYVAMTRARDQLHLSYSGEPSPWLIQAQKSGKLEFADWREYVMNYEESDVRGKPHHLPQADTPTNSDSWKGLTGRQFNYTPNALGLELTVLQKVDLLVDGIGLTTDGKRTRWRDMGAALNDLSHEPSARNVFGPVVQERLRLHLGELE